MKSFWLQNEFYYLKVEDKNILTTEDVWLNDRIMDAVQKLICKALGKIDSYQLVLNSEKKTNYPLRTVNNEHYDGNSHWLLYFCSSGRVQICDNLESHASRITLRNLNALYQSLKNTTSGKLT